MLVSQTIRDALIDIAVINPTDEAAPQDTEYALRELNRILDDYNTSKLLIPYTTKITYPATDWQSPEITIGLDDTNMLRSIPPVFVDEVIFTQGRTDYKMDLFTLDQFAALPNKRDTVTIPSYYTTNVPREGTVSILLDTVPQQDLILSIYANMGYSTSLSPTDDIKWGTGVENMLKLKLGVALSSSYGLPPDQMLIARAAAAENNVKSFNYKPTINKPSSVLMRGRTSTKYNLARF